MTTDTLIPVGKIAGTHGIRGELRVTAYAGEATALLVVRSVRAQAADGSVETLRISRARFSGKKLLLACAGLTDINQVQHLVGRELLVSREQLPAPDDDEYYWQDLIGLRVLTSDGRELGRLCDIMETGSNDVYVVRENDREYLIPALADVVVQIDLKNGCMTIDPLEGLLDL